MRWRRSCLESGGRSWGVVGALATRLPGSPQTLVSSCSSSLKEEGRRKDGMEMEGMEIEEEQMRFKKIDKKVGKGSEGKCREVTHSQKKNDGEFENG